MCNGPNLSDKTQNNVALPKDMSNLLRQHERQEAVSKDLREKLRSTRMTLGTKERALETAHKTIGRLSSENRSLQDKHAAALARVKRLETQLERLKNVSALQDACSKLKTEVDVQRMKAEDAQALAKRTQEELEHSKNEVELLQRAVQMAAEQLTQSSGIDVGASLLEAAAQGQQEASFLSRKLADSDERVTDMKNALRLAKLHLRAQHEALLQWTKWKQEQDDKITKLEEKLNVSESSNHRHQDIVQELTLKLQQAETMKNDHQRQIKELQARLHRSNNNSSPSHQQNVRKILACLKDSEMQASHASREAREERIARQRAESTIECLERELRDKSVIEATLRKELKNVLTKKKQQRPDGCDGDIIHRQLSSNRPAWKLDRFKAAAEQHPEEGIEDTARGSHGSRRSKNKNPIVACLNEFSDAAMRDGEDVSSDFDDIHRHSPTEKDLSLKVMPARSTSPDSLDDLAMIAKREDSLAEGMASIERDLEKITQQLSLNASLRDVWKPDSFRGFHSDHKGREDTGLQSKDGDRQRVKVGAYDNISAGGETHQVHKSKGSNIFGEMMPAADAGGMGLLDQEENTSPLSSPDRSIIDGRVVYERHQPPKEAAVACKLMWKKNPLAESTDLTTNGSALETSRADTIQKIRDPPGKNTEEHAAGGIPKAKWPSESHGRSSAQFSIDRQLPEEEEEAWKVLESGLDQQRLEDMKLMSLWQKESEDPMKRMTESLTFIEDSSRSSDEGTAEAAIKRLHGSSEVKQGGDYYSRVKRIGLSKGEADSRFKNLNISVPFSIRNSADGHGHMDEFQPQLESSKILETGVGSIVQTKSISSSSSAVEWLNECTEASLRALESDRGVVDETEITLPSSTPETSHLEDASKPQARNAGDTKPLKMNLHVYAGILKDDMKPSFIQENKTFAKHNDKGSKPSAKPTLFDLASMELETALLES